MKPEQPVVVWPPAVKLTFSSRVNWDTKFLALATAAAHDPVSTCSAYQEISMAHGNAERVLTCRINRWRLTVEVNIIGDDIFRLLLS